MTFQIIQALNPLNWFSSSDSSETGVDGEGAEESDPKEEYENPEHSPLKDSRKLRDDESEIFEDHLDSDLLDTQYSRETVKWDIKDRKNDLSDLQVQIRYHWETYKHWMQEAKEDNGIDEMEAKTKAKSAKQAAKDKEQLYKLLWKELDSLKNSVRKDEQIRILSGDKYSVSFTEMDSASAEEAAQHHSQVLRKRKMNVDQFQKGVSRTDEDVEIDFSDIEKDVQELEMQDMGDIDIFIEGEGELEQPKPETGTGEEWS
jgi:hypothetical protein